MEWGPCAWSRQQGGCRGCTRSSESALTLSFFSSSLPARVCVRGGGAFDRCGCPPEQTPTAAAAPSAEGPKHRSGVLHPSPPPPLSPHPSESAQHDGVRDSRPARSKTHACIWTCSGTEGAVCTSCTGTSSGPHPGTHRSCRTLWRGRAEAGWLRRQAGRQAAALLASALDGAGWVSGEQPNRITLVQPRVIFCPKPS